MTSEQLEALRHQARVRLPIPAARVEELLNLIDGIIEHQSITDAQAFSEGWEKGRDEGLEIAAKFCEEHDTVLFENAAAAIRAMKGKSE